MRLIDADLVVEKIKAKCNSGQWAEEVVYGMAKALYLVKSAQTIERPHGEWKPLKWKDEETKCKLLDYPYDGKWVIVTDGKNISVERIKIDALDHFSPAGRWFELENVVAWMQLPEPYKEAIE